MFRSTPQADFCCLFQQSRWLLAMLQPTNTQEHVSLVGENTSDSMLGHTTPGLLLVLALLYMTASSIDSSFSFLDTRPFKLLISPVYDISTRWNRTVLTITRHGACGVEDELCTARLGPALVLLSASMILRAKGYRPVCRKQFKFEACSAWCPTIISMNVCFSSTILLAIDHSCD